MSPNDFFGKIEHTRSKLQRTIKFSSAQDTKHYFSKPTGPPLSKEIIDHAVNV